MTDKPSEYQLVASRAAAHYREVAKVHEAVGDGISTWAMMEIWVIHIAAALMNTTEDKAGTVLYSVNNFYTWINIIEELFAADASHAQSRKDWSGVVSKLKSLNDTRIRLAHQAVHTGLSRTASGLQFELDGLKASTYDLRSKWKRMPPLRLKEVERFKEDVVRVSNRLIEIVLRMRGFKHDPKDTLDDDTICR